MVKYRYSVERHPLAERQDTAGRRLAAAHSYTVERPRATEREYTAVRRPTAVRLNTAACRHTGKRDDDAAASLDTAVRPHAAGSGWLRMTRSYNKYLSLTDQSESYGRKNIGLFK